MRKLFKRGRTVFFLIALVGVLAGQTAFALSRGLPEPEIFFPKSCDSERVEAVQKILQMDGVDYLGGLVSYWEPHFSSTLVYDGDEQMLAGFLGKLNTIDGVTVRLTFSADLARETGGALKAGSWWVVYSHTMPDTITVRINLASARLGGGAFALRLPKAAS